MRNRRFIFVMVLMLMLSISIVLFLRCNNSSYQICESQYTLDSGYTFTNIQVCGMRDKKLEEKINESLNSRFFILVEPWFDKTRVKEWDPVIHCQSERYLSVQYTFEYTTAENVYWHLCITVDTQTGEVVCLDDLINIDDDFAMVVKNGGILKKDAVENWYTAEEVTERTNEYFSQRDMEYILRFFRKYTQEYLYGDFYRKNKKQNYETYIYTEYFYLEEGKIRFTSANSSSGFSTTWIALDDIEEHLKVPKW